MIQFPINVPGSRSAAQGATDAQTGENAHDATDTGAAALFLPLLLQMLPQQQTAQTAPQSAGLVETGGEEPVPAPVAMPGLFGDLTPGTLALRVPPDATFISAAPKEMPQTGNQEDLAPEPTDNDHSASQQKTTAADAPVQPRSAPVNPLGARIAELLGSRKKPAEQNSGLADQQAKPVPLTETARTSEPARPPHPQPARAETPAPDATAPVAPDRQSVENRVADKQPETPVMPPPVHPRTSRDKSDTAPQTMPAEPAVSGDAIRTVASADLKDFVSRISPEQASDEATPDTEEKSGGSEENSAASQQTVHVQQSSSDRTTTPLAQGKPHQEKAAGDETAAVRPATIGTTHETHRNGTTEMPELPVLPKEVARSIVDQVSRAISLKSSEKGSEIRMTLKPESLGELVIKVSLDNGTVKAQIDVAQPQVKAALESHIVDLRSAIQSHGIEVKSIEIFAQTNGAPGESGGQQQTRGRNQGKRRWEDEEDEMLQSGRQMGYNTMEITI